MNEEEENQDDGNGQTSISISIPSVADKIDGGNMANKIIYTSASYDSNSSQGQVEVGPNQAKGHDQVQDSTDKEEQEEEEEGPINNLPPEILTKILNLVDTQTLIKCRVISRRWSEISTAIFRNRPPLTPIWFHWEGSTETFCQKDLLSKSLKEFVECAKNCSQENGPFLSFWFTTQGPKCFDDEDFLEFLSIFSSRRIKHVQLKASYHGGELHMLTNKLARFLLNDVPQLEELHFELSLKLNWRSFGPVEYSQVSLFPLNKNTGTVGAPLPLPAHFQLPNLKLLHLDSWTILPHLQIAKDLLNAAVNLTQIKTTVMSPGHFEFFHSLGKLHLLKELVLCFNDDFIKDMNSEQFGFQDWSYPRFQLETFHLQNNMELTDFDQVSLGQASNLISTLLDWSKDSLKELEMDSSPCLVHLQLPVFKGLRTLKINGSGDHQIFPSGARTKDIFPAVDSLKLSVENWPLAFPQSDSIPLLPSVKTLVLKEWIFVYSDVQTDTIVSVLAQLCPNLSKLVIQKYKDEWRPPQLIFIQVGRSIWTHMKQLEFLQVDLDLDKPEHNSIALDSCFTGISYETVRRLLKLREQLVEEHGVSVKIPETTLTAERAHPSILDMKHLKNLTVNPYLGNVLLDKTEFYTNKLTWVSQNLAFKLMPHLKLNGEDFQVVFDS